MPAFADSAVLFLDQNAKRQFARLPNSKLSCLNEKNGNKAEPEAPKAIKALRYFLAKQVMFTLTMSIAHFYVIRVNSWSMCSFVVCPTEQSISAFAHARMFGNERMQNFTTYIPAQRSFCRMFSVERFEQAVAFHQTVLYSVYLTYFSGNYQRPSFLSFLGYSLSITIIEHRSVQLDLISCTVATNDIVKLAVQSTQPASESENATNLYCNLSVILTQSITG